MWDLPRPGLEPVSPVLAGGFLTTAPPGKSPYVVFELPFELSSSSAVCSTTETAQLLLVVSDGRGLFFEGKDRVLAAVQAARNANIFVIFVVLDNPSSRVSDY